MCERRWVCVEVGKTIYIQTYANITWYGDCVLGEGGGVTVCATLLNLRSMVLRSSVSV